MSFLEKVCQTQNIWERYNNLLKTFANVLVLIGKVTGIIILGGIAKNGSRQFADSSSDLDIAIVLSIPHLPQFLLELPFPLFSTGVQPYLPDWLPNFKFRVPKTEIQDDSVIDIDVHQLILEYERQSHIVWDIGKIEAYAANSRIYFDQSGSVQSLIDNKLAAHRHILQDLPITTLASAPVRLTTDVERCIKRNLFSSAHEIMNAALEDILMSVYAVNGEFAPNRKWRLVSLDVLPWIPADARDRFEKALLVQSHTKQDVRRRQKILLSLLKNVKVYCQRQFPGFPKDPYTYACTHIYPDRQLRHTTYADHQIIPLIDQYEKMEQDQWNKHNWSLDAGKV